MIRRLRPVMVKMLRWIGIVTFLLRLHPAVLWFGRRRVRVLAYHRCDELETDDEFLRDLVSNTSPELFRTHVQFLKRYYTIISLEALATGNVPDRSAAITFDDGYASVYRNAFPILRDNDASATVFLTTGVMDNVSLIWAIELNWFLRTYPELAVPMARQRLGLPCQAGRREILSWFEARYDQERLNELLREMRTRVGVTQSEVATRLGLYLTWDQVHEMARFKISFGNHTVTHPNLARLDRADQHLEIADAHDAVVRHLGRCTSFSYPFGDGDANAQQVAGEMGYSVICEVGGGNERPCPNRLGRLPVTARSAAELFADLEFVAPLVSWFRRRRDRRLETGESRGIPASATTP